MAMPFTDNGEIVGSIPTRAIRNIKNMAIMAKWLTHRIVTPTSWVQFPLVALILR